ncbi:MAG: YgaP-like transmembrane domain [Verrucomicrobiota bacterium]
MGFWDQNIDQKGRIFRAVMGVLTLIPAVVIFFSTDLWWLALIFLLSAAFCFFEASRGWCALRACKIKTPL